MHSGRSWNIQPDVFAPNLRRSVYAEVLREALAAVDPYQCVRQVLQRSGARIRAGGAMVNLEHVAHVWVLGFGKAAAVMAQAVEDVLDDYVDGGIVVVKDGYAVPTRRVQVMEAGHPVPDERSVQGAQAVLALAQKAQEDDLVLVVISGGGSALLTLPAEGVTLEDIRTTTEVLLRAGATINELNAVRKHLSAVKGGQLARALAPARVIGLVLSDVIGNPLDVIASGPLSPDPTTFADAWAVLEKYRVLDKVPPRVREHLQAGMAGAVRETPKPGDPVFDRVHMVIVGDNAHAATAAARAAANRGYRALILTTFLEGEAREVAKAVAALGKEVVRHRRPVPPPACLILGGETTVTVGGGGKGGRNQELALSAALTLEGWPDITVIALGTDGTDGPTDAAGGMVDGGTVQRARDAGLDPLRHLQNNDAYPVLAATHDLIRTGPTRTNVNDLVLVFVERS